MAALPAAAAASNAATSSPGEGKASPLQLSAAQADRGVKLNLNKPYSVVVAGKTAASPAADATNQPAAGKSADPSKQSAAKCGRAAKSYV